MDEFAAALHQLKAFNRMIASDPALSRRLIEGDHDFLQWQQAKLFVAFRERYRKSTRPAPPSPETKSLGPVRAWASYLFSGLASCAMTLWAACARRRPEALVFSVDKISAGKDHDFRLDGLYRFLAERKIAFTEVFHTNPKSLVVHARGRRRAAVYHEAFEFMAALRLGLSRGGVASRRLAASCACEGFDEAERPYVRTLIERLLNGAVSSRFKIRWYRLALRCLRPRLILGIDDTRYYHELCASARAEGVPSYVFQHGHFTKYHAGWLAHGAGKGKDLRPDALFVWSPYWKQELLRLGTNFRDEELRTGGNPKGEASGFAAPPYAPPADGPIGLLVPFESDVPFDEMKTVMKALLADGRVKIWFKTRPDWDKEEQLRRYGLDGQSADRVEAVADHKPVLDRIHAVAGVYSTFLYDALSTLRPVFILKTTMDVGEGMLINGLADPLDASSPDLASHLARLCVEASPKLKDRLDRYQGGSGNLTETLEKLVREAKDRPSSRT